MLTWQISRQFDEKIDSKILISLFHPKLVGTNGTRTIQCRNCVVHWSKNTIFLVPDSYLRSMPKDFQLSPFPNLFEKLVFKSRHRPFNLGPERQKRKKIIQQRFKFRSTQKSAFLLFRQLLLLIFLVIGAKCGLCIVSSKQMVGGPHWSWMKRQPNLQQILAKMSYLHLIFFCFYCSLKN